jgi:N-acetylmuramoyl-L-alanine amidase
VTSPNQDDRPQGAPIDHLVLHYTGMRSAADAIARLCDTEAKVSSHYVIEEDGTTHQLVPEGRRAWHAGISFWRGVRNLNDRSIGIEIVNPGHEWGYRAFPAPQIAAVTDLAQAILGRHPIPGPHVVAHSDIAPDRKQDPGELFPWRGLAAHGIGLWDEGAGTSADPLADLASIGYDPCFNPALSITAFQRRFHPVRCDGILDVETAGRIGVIARLFENSCISI